MVNYERLRIGILVFACLSLLSSCGSLRRQSKEGLVVVDETGRYSEGKTKEMLEEATTRINVIHRKLGKDPVFFRGRKLVFKKSKSKYLNVSELIKAVNAGKENDTSIAGAQYIQLTGTLNIYSYVKKPSREAIIHELGHGVLLSNRIWGHKSRYKEAFLNWSD